MIIHTGLTDERWFSLSLLEQLANIGTDIECTIYSRNAGNHDDSQKAFWRALELIDFTVRDPKNRNPDCARFCAPAKHS